AEGQAGPNSGVIPEPQPLTNPGVLAGPNREHPEAEVGDSSSQQQIEHIDEGFTAT
nr:hypothetical protein [Tanacetum cinerariifolium]